jgi:pimeloyl-ACP methyl ester carboxylesterase
MATNRKAVGRKNETMLIAIRWLLTLSGWISTRLAARLAGVLFCLPLPLSLSSRRQAPTAGAEILSIPSGRHRIAVYRWPAAGPARAGRILLVHGWAGRGSQWRHFVKPLREAGFEVLALDQPAHGRSSGWTVNLPQCIRTVQKVAQVFGPLSGIVGHSLGGNAVAVAAAGLEVERVVLVSALADPEREIERFAEIVGLPDETRRAMQRHFESLEEMPLAELHVDHAGPRIPQPVLIVHDRDDDVIPYDDALGYARRIPHARLMPTEGLSHRRILKEETVIREIVQFLTAAATGRVAA